MKLESFEMSNSQDGPEQFPDIDDEKGLSAEGFEKKDKRIKGGVEKSLAERRTKPVKFYFIFKNSEDRDKAKWYVDEDSRKWQTLPTEQARSQALFGETFRGYAPDPRRQEVGLELSFKRNPDSLRQDLRNYFISKGVTPVEDYPAIEGDLRPLRLEDEEVPKPRDIKTISTKTTRKPREFREAA